MFLEGMLLLPREANPENDSSICEIEVSIMITPCRSLRRASRNASPTLK